MSQELKEIAAECQFVEKKFLDPETMATPEKNREVLRFLLGAVARLADHLQLQEDVKQEEDYP